MQVRPRSLPYRGAPLRYSGTQVLRYSGTLQPYTETSDIQVLRYSPSGLASDGGVSGVAGGGYVKFSLVSEGKEIYPKGVSSENYTLQYIRYIIC